MTVYLKLAGPNTKGLNPKGCYTKGWTDPFYKGVGDDYVSGDTWIGLRLDDFILVDCDNEAAMEAWRAHIGFGVGDAWDTWTRKTPNGWHFFYRRTVDTYGVKAKVPWFIPKVDLKVGPGHLAVLTAPGYQNVWRGPESAANFDLAWLPAVMETANAEEWNEVPEGRRNSFLTAMGGKMRSLGADERAIARGLGSLNRLIEPPLSDREVRNIAKSMARYEPDERTTVECLACGAEMEIR